MSHGLEHGWNRLWPLLQFNPTLGDAPGALRLLCGGMMGLDRALCQGQFYGSVGDRVLQPSCATALQRGGLEPAVAFPSSSFSLDTSKAFVLCSVGPEQDAGQLLITRTGLCLHFRSALLCGRQQPQRRALPLQGKCCLFCSTTGIQV